ncbi:MAG TPA: carbohydrate-binding family 9-like protein [Fimbriimonadaceae bacterium]|nr:carbohydrate-binding family 9-like protein [Fimbriimonadaceae bacterium]
MDSYSCLRTSNPPIIDGDLTKPAWADAHRTARFVDMATGVPAILDTEAALLWDDEALYVAFWVSDPQPAARLTERDSLIFSENDVEVFLAGDDCYYEFEMNALGTVYEVFFVWKDALRRGSRFDRPEFDLFERDVATFGGNFDREEASFWRGTHPRGLRWAFLDWDLPGLEVATRIQGELNNPHAASIGWTAEIKFPWQGLRVLGGSRAVPPRPGDEWHVFLGRFQKLVVGEREVQAAWCATPHGTYDTHMPERFTRVAFVDSA